MTSQSIHRDQCPRQNFQLGVQGGGVQSTSIKSLSLSLPLSPTSVTIVQSIAVYLHVYNCLVIISEYKSALHAMTLMVGAAASETLIGVILAQLGGAPPHNSLERTLIVTIMYTTP